MKNKRIATMFLAAMIIGSLSGCGAAPEETMQPETVEETDTKADEEALAAAKAAEEAEAEKKAAEEAAAKEAEADEYYEKGRTDLYGTDGKEISLESAYANFEKAKELGKQDANFYLGLLCDWYNYPKQDYEAARKYYEDSGENPYAKVALGILYYAGQGLEKDGEKAEELFQEAIEQGCAEGYLGIALLKEDNDDKAGALENYTKVVEAGTEQVFIAEAMNLAGYLYQHGEGAEQDYAKAMEWYEKAADLGNASAMNNIGYLYRAGEGVEQDYAKTMEWFEKAADLGNTAAMNNIGYLYEAGEGVEQDYAKAMEWYEKAADLGETAAMSSIAYLYYSGEGIEQDYGKAIEWYEKAANLGDISAINNIASFYYLGKGVEQDYDKAIEWYEKAADMGDETAMNGIGNAYNEMGDYEKAAEWYEKAANLGHAVAMNNIGFAYYSGQGVEQDYEKALEWLEKAVEAGNEDAKEGVKVVKALLNQ